MQECLRMIVYLSIAGRQVLKRELRLKKLFKIDRSQNYIHNVQKEIWCDKYLLVYMPMTTLLTLFVLQTSHFRHV